MPTAVPNAPYAPPPQPFPRGRWEYAPPFVGRYERIFGLLPPQSAKPAFVVHPIAPKAMAERQFPYHASYSLNPQDYFANVVVSDIMYATMT